MPPAIRIATEGLCAIHDLRAGCSAAVQWSSGVLTVTFQLVGSDEDRCLWRSWLQGTQRPPPVRMCNGKMGTPSARAWAQLVHQQKAPALR